MTKNKKTVITITLAALMMALTFGTGTHSLAAEVQATLKAQFKALKILLNGQTVTMESQPIIVNGSTYLPLRAFANLFNKNVDWNASLQQISITDKPDNEVASLKAQIAAKDNQILILQTQLTAKSENSSLSDMQKQLNNDYGDYKKLDVNITLSGTKSKITVKVDVKSKSKWNALSSANRTTLLQDIVDDLRDEYDDPTISGTVKAGSTSISSFSVKSSGTVKIDSSSSNNSDFDDLVDDLMDNYDELGDIDDINIVLDGDEDLITFTVEIDYDDWDDDWDDLSDTKISTYLKEIRSDIIDALDDNDYDLDDYEDAKVRGYIVDTSNNDKEMSRISTSGNVVRSSSYD